MHGNRWALEAVLEDLRTRDVDGVVNLGDSVYGPLEPGGTARLLRDLDPPSVRGNQDRLVLDPPAEVRGTDTFRHVRSALGVEDLAWLDAHGTEPLVRGTLLFCHGTPESDEEYLAEEVGEFGVAVRPPGELAEKLEGVGQDVVVCGHSHVPRLLADAEGRLVVNPGSVGLPAYTDGSPLPHSMEAGSPHARYAVLRTGPGGTSVDHRSVSYDWESAARAAARNGRPDWSEWLEHGCAPPETEVLERGREERIARALAWVTSRLRELEVPFQAVGGLAAFAHGARRPLTDIDLYVPEGALDRLQSALADHHVHGPRRQRLERWDCYMMEVGYAGEEIELAEAGRTRYRADPDSPWREADVDFAASEWAKVLGVEVPVMPVDRLVEYKRRLGRPVDEEDLAALGGTG